MAHLLPACLADSDVLGELLHDSGETSVQLQLNGIAYNIQERGTGTQRQLVFLHDFGSSGRSWDRVIDGLEVIQYLETDVQCYAPDLRGFGDTAAPATGYTVADYADDVATLIDHVGLQCYGLVGHGMGGKNALKLAARRLPGLEVLLLLAPASPRVEPMPAEERTRLLAGHGDYGVAEDWIQSLAFGGLPDAILAQAVEDVVRTSPAAWHAWLEHGTREDISPCLAEIEVPVYVLAGEYDRLMPPHLYEQEIVAHVEWGHLWVEPAVGHLIPLEAPQAVTNTLHEMLL